MTINISNESFMLDELQQIITKSSNNTNSSNEQVLFLSVILQALLDATKPEHDRESEESIMARASAKAWFCASVGVTSEDFMDVCDIAGIDPMCMRSFAYKVITSKSIPFVRKRINTLLTF
jgi:hypothetical protein